jgi:hypothetical protein
MSAAQFTEKARKVILAQIKNNIVAELAAVRADRADPTVNVQNPREYFSFDGAHTYQCPAIFIVADSFEMPEEKTEANYLNARLKFYVSAVVEGQDAGSLVVLAERYQAALIKILHWQTLTDLTLNTKDWVRVVRGRFSPLYTKERKADNMGSFRKEVSLELEVQHFENPTT